MNVVFLLSARHVRLRISNVREILWLINRFFDLSNVKISLEKSLDLIEHARQIYHYNLIVNISEY